ncbi:MAG: flagellar biosynthesis protein FlhA [Planctomycetaceae bacterium]
MAATATTTLDLNHAFARRSEMLLSAALLGVLIVLLVPLPTVLLDMFLAVNIGITILLLLVTLSATQPLDVSVFPSLLLLITLFRLSLNVATTRLILLNGDAGRIVSTFGGFVVGGNLVVGLVIFLILIIIQFIVITKGAGRVSEVAARFTLDAMPGKQMAIDAELSVGTIDEREARRRRQMLAREAEFYGAMDGSSKFVRGDAVAGLIITAINLLGGVIIGLTHGMTLGEAVQRYSILTVGDGLVSQIPALIVATTAGILVTKSTSETSLGHEIAEQLSANHRPLKFGAIVLGLLALAPGLPKLPFLLLSGGLLIGLRRLKTLPAKAKKPEPEPTQRPKSAEEDQAQEFLESDRVCVEIGARLIPLVNSQRSKNLIERIAGLRREMTRKYGLWVPAIRIRDNVQLQPEEYRILISGREVSRAKLFPDLYLAIDPGNTQLSIDGEDAVEPAFGLPAKWIGPNVRQRAELGGFTVVDPPTVLTTHLGEIVRRYAHELLSREDLQKLLEKVKETAPTIFDELKPDVLRAAVLHQVLILLLQERVPITNLTRILETLINHAAQIKAPEELADRVREELGRSICDSFRDDRGRVRVIVCDPRLEMSLREALRDKNLALQPAHLERLIVSLSNEWQKASVQGQEMALLTDRNLRRPLRKAIERALPDLSVVSYLEIPNDLLIEPTAMIRLEDVFQQKPAAKGFAEAAISGNTISDELALALKAA